MRKIILLLLLLSLSSCVSYWVPESIQGEDRDKLVKTKELVDAVRKCSAEARSNDAYFSKNCTKIVKNKPLYGKFMSARSGYRGFYVEVSGYFNGILECDTKQRNASDLIAKLNVGSPVVVTGRLKGYSQMYVNSSASGRPTLDLADCTIKPSKIEYPKY